MAGALDFCVSVLAPAAPGGLVSVVREPAFGGRARLHLLDSRSVKFAYLDPDAGEAVLRLCAADTLEEALVLYGERGRVERTLAVWDHLSATVSAPFVAGENAQVAVKVIDDRGNELLVVKKLEEAR
jgi:hypothetical protein